MAKRQNTGLGGVAGAAVKATSKDKPTTEDPNSFSTSRGRDGDRDDGSNKAKRSKVPTVTVVNDDEEGASPDDIVITGSSSRGAGPSKVQRLLSHVSDFKDDDNTIRGLQSRSVFVGQLIAAHEQEQLNKQKATLKWQAENPPDNSVRQLQKAIVEALRPAHLRGPATRGLIQQLSELELHGAGDASADADMDTAITNLGNNAGISSPGEARDLYMRVMGRNAEVSSMPRAVDIHRKTQKLQMTNRSNSATVTTYALSGFVVDNTQSFMNPDAKQNRVYVCNTPQRPMVDHVALHQSTGLVYVTPSKINVKDSDRIDIARVLNNARTLGMYTTYRLNSFHFLPSFTMKDLRTLIGNYNEVKDNMSAYQHNGSISLFKYIDNNVINSNCKQSMLHLAELLEIDDSHIYVPTLERANMTRQFRAARELLRFGCESRGDTNAFSVLLDAAKETFVAVLMLLTTNVQSLFCLEALYYVSHDADLIGSLQRLLIVIEHLKAIPQTDAAKFREMLRELLAYLVITQNDSVSHSAKNTLSELRHLDLSDNPDKIRTGDKPPVLVKCRVSRTGGILMDIVDRLGSAIEYVKLYVDKEALWSTAGNTYSDEHVKTEYAQWVSARPVTPLNLKVEMPILLLQPNFSY